MSDITNITHIAPFVPDSDPTSVAQRWKRWSDRFDNLTVALDITDPARQKALLLHLAGDAVYDISRSRRTRGGRRRRSRGGQRVYKRETRAGRLLHSKTKH